jgi:hypothetical protein
MTPPRDLVFLRESDGIEGLPGPARGHFAALSTSQAEAKAATPLSAELICSWQAVIVGSDTVSVPDAARAALSRLADESNRRLVKIAAASDVTITEVIADALYGVAASRAFGDGRIARLVANHLATRCGVPILVFRASEAAALREALGDRLATRCWIADKLREAVFTHDGRVLERTQAGDQADHYDGVLVERHELLEAQASWRRALGAPRN